MNEKELLDKIYRQLDGELSEPETEELERYLADHPEASVLAGQCKKVKDQFGEAQSCATGPNLAPGIMQRINREKYMTRKKQPEVFDLHEFWRRPAFRYAFTFVAGVFAGIMLFTFAKLGFQFTPADTNLLKGTISNSDSPVNWTPGEVVTFQGWQVKSTILTRYSKSIAEIYLDLSSLDMIETTMEFNTGDFELLAVVSEKVDANTTISTAADLVRIQSSGDNKIAVKLTNRNDQQHDIVLKINQRGNQLYQNTIIINKY